MAGDRDIRLHDIRAHEGSQARAWEELAYQLRPTPGPGHVETRKTRAPDGGVEWYEVYADGHEEGFQAKFYRDLAATLGGMDQSVKAVTTKRPQMTRLTFVVPYDFSDSGTDDRITDQDRWTNKVATWKKNVSGASDIDFRIIRGGDITAQLTRAEHAGRRAYWFKQLELTDEWFNRRWNEARRGAGERYTPEADTPSPINDILAAAVRSRTYLHQLRVQVEKVLSACRSDIGMWGDEPVGELLMRLDAWLQVTAPQVGSGGDDFVATHDPDFAALSDLTGTLSAMAWQRHGVLDPYRRGNLQDALSAIDTLDASARSKRARVCTQRVAAVVGAAGQGKTHALLRCARGLLDAKLPTVVVLGDRMRDDNWWPALAGVLGGGLTSSDEFLQALDSMAEARGCRAVLIIDALNESEDPYRWRTELPALLEAVREHPHVALLVSFRNDYRDVVLSADDLLPVFNHPGIAGHEQEALQRYCRLFNVAVPADSLLDAAFTNPLFLRMYCEVLAKEPAATLTSPTRSTLFSRFAKIKMDHVRHRLRLTPTAELARQALDQVSDLLIGNQGRPVPRSPAEANVDALLPGRLWPGTLFQSMVSDGVLELRPAAGGDEHVGLPFQALSEHLLGTRLLALHNASHLLDASSETPARSALAPRLSNERWLWRSLAVLLPEQQGVELIDLLGDREDVASLTSVTWISFLERATSAFSPRTLELLEASLDLHNPGMLEVLLSLAPRPGHPANADWLTERLLAMAMPERDAWWSVATVDVQETGAYQRLEGWVRAGISPTSPSEQIRLAGLLLMWLLTSSNRFLRDHTSKLLSLLLSQRLSVTAHLLEIARQVDDPYVQERMLTCAYGAVMTGGDADPAGVREVCTVLSHWRAAQLPINVLARDAARGIMTWAHHHGLIDAAELQRFDSPYGASAPTEPPTAEALEQQHGPLKDDAGEYTDWRAHSILSSCLDWMGDFNKYVVKSDVGYFSLHLLAGPPPTDRYNDPLGEVSANWAGRWIAHRALELGWSTERFDAFESSHDLHSGRDAHKVERIGKKYQWIALHELLARLADNYHPAHEGWREGPACYQGPWPWYGRDLDPSLPPSRNGDGRRVCRLQQPLTPLVWLPAPNLNDPTDPDAWVTSTADLPTPEQLFNPVDETGRSWVALHRYASWNRDDARRRDISTRDRDTFILQFAWLTPRGDGQRLLDVLRTKSMYGRWMKSMEGQRTHGQYLGEAGWSPIEQSRQPGLYMPQDLLDAKLHDIRPAAEEWLWEGNTKDCSLDDTINLTLPSIELLGDATWQPHTTSWALDGTTVCLALDAGNDDDGLGADDGQSILLADANWLRHRLDELDADLVLAVMSERHAMSPDEDSDRSMAFSDVTYVGLITATDPPNVAGPALTLRRNLAGNIDNA